jgi:hypothetical protein
MNALNETAANACALAACSCDLSIMTVPSDRPCFYKTAKARGVAPDGEAWEPFDFSKAKKGQRMKDGNNADVWRIHAVHGDKLGDGTWGNCRLAVENTAQGKGHLSLLIWID